MLPRIVPWTTFDEFRHVFELIYNSDGDSDSQRQGCQLHRRANELASFASQIEVWMLRGNCPHAAESTAAFLELVLRDSGNVGASVRPTELEQRLGYSMALIRFVNSLIDPLQTTYYARSMATLATQIGLPLWFVELRHAATHEHLPSLVVLQDAAKQALDWLYTNYWVKTISGSGATQPLLPLDDLRALLAAYKGFAKTSVRDASQVNKVKSDVQKCIRGIEAWVGEAESFGRGRDRAIEGLVEALVQVGALVPTAKKQVFWSLGSPFSFSVEVNQIDRTLIATYSAWIIELVKNAEDNDLMQSTVRTCLLAASPNSLSFVENLTKDDEHVNLKVKKLVNARRNFDTGLPQQLDVDQFVTKLDEMEIRRRELDQRILAIHAQTNADAMDVTDTDLTRTQGWKLVPNWKPCPIGMLPDGRLSDLDWQWWKDA
ncbi:rRNA-processing protein las1 [Microbotryomycetes sp. JL201]|nr:rRNA-processing protein las1 [Microbotryomycetes sp. JL201]